MGTFKTQKMAQKRATSCSAVFQVFKRRISETLAVERIEHPPALELAQCQRRPGTISGRHRLRYQMTCRGALSVHECAIDVHDPARTGHADIRHQEGHSVQSELPSVSSSFCRAIKEETFF